MSDFQSTISLGQECELYNRVNGNDPANSAFIMLILAAAGIDDDATLKDYQTVAALLGGSSEVANAGYGRKTITDADLAPYSVDYANDVILLTLPLQTFAAIGVGDHWAKGVIAYDSDTTVGSDANIMPVSYFDIIAAGGGPIIPNTFDIEIDLSYGWLEAQ